jgi:ketosteroid isomerase-like protein
VPSDPGEIRDRFLAALARDDKEALLAALQGGFELFNRRDLDALFEFLDPDIVWETPPQFPIPGPHRGHDAVRQLIQGWFESMEELRLEVEDVFRRGDEFVLFVLQRVRGSASGVELENRIAHVWRIENDRVVRIRIYPNREEALESVGIAGDVQKTAPGP